MVSGITQVAGITAVQGGGSSGDSVTASAVIADNAVVRGDGGVRGVQSSTAVLGDNGSLILSSAVAGAFVVGQNGATNPAFTVDASTASSVTGIAVTSKAAGDGVTITTLSSGTNEALTISSKASAAVTLNAPSSTAQLTFQVNTSAKMSVTNNAINFTPATSTTASNPRLYWNGAANTTLTAGTEFTQIHFDMSDTNQHASNTNITTQRDMIIDGMEHSFQSATGTITDAYALYITAPSAGANAIVTNAWSMGVDGYISAVGIVESLNSRVSTQYDATDTTLANVTGLTATLLAGKTYAFRAVLFVDADAAGGAKYAIAGTATATAVIYQINSIANTTNVYAINSRETALGGDAGVAGDTAYYTEIAGTITVNAAGTLTVQFAQNVDTGTSSVLVGSTFEVKRIT